MTAESASESNKLPMRSIKTNASIIEAAGAWLGNMARTMFETNSQTVEVESSAPAAPAPVLEEKEEDGSDDEDDDDAPEVVSTTRLASEIKRSAQKAQQASNQQAATLKQKRRERDSRLTQQAQARREAESAAAAAAADIAAKAEAAAAVLTEQQQRTRLAAPRSLNILPAEFLTDSDSDADSDLSPGLAGRKSLAAKRDGPARPKRRKVETIERQLTKRRKGPADKMIGGTVYRVMKSTGNGRLAPVATKQSANAREMLLRRNRSAVPARRGFFTAKS